MFQVIFILKAVTIIAFSFIFDRLVVTSGYCGGGSDTCSNGIIIKYPFRDNRDDCGYEGLEMRCGHEDGRAVMNISNHFYYVLSINYEQKSLRLVDVDLDKQECPHPKQNFSLESTPLLNRDKVSNKNWYIFYNCSSQDIFNNCTTYAPSDFTIPCLNYYFNSTTVPLRSSYAFRSTNFDDPSDEDDIPNWYKNCGKCQETVVVIPMVTLNSFNFTKEAKYGFDLYWSVPNNDCKKCEHRGGYCSKTAEAYVCNCPYGCRGQFAVCLALKTESPAFYWQHDYANTNKNFMLAGLSTGLKILIGVSIGVGGLLLLFLVLLIWSRVTSGGYKILKWGGQRRTKKKPSSEQRSEQRIYLNN